MISANGGLPAHRYTPQVTLRWPRGSEPASGHGAALAEAPGLEVVVGCDIVDKGGVLGMGVESTDQVDQPRRHSIVVEDPTEGGVGRAVKGLVKIYVKMVGLGASGDVCRDV